MSNPNETTEEAVAALRRYADFVQKHSGEITVGHDALREYAARIEAAAKQEAIDAELKWTRIGYDERKAEEKRAHGNSAEMREALIYVRDLMRRVKDGDRVSSFAFLGVVEHALAAPARNCDRFQTAKDAVEGYIAAHPHDDEPDASTYGSWLFAPAKEGGAE